jgi:AcrR family transcriptional regulator
MGVTERRERERQETRQRILDAARDLFVHEGYEAVSMRKIAEKIEYSPTAIYHHFRDKQALLEELCVNDFRALAAAFLRIGRVEDPVERLRKIGEAYVAFGLQNQSQYRFMFMTPGIDASDSEQSQEMKGNPEEDAYAFLRATIAEAIAQGRFRPEYADADLVSQIVWAGSHGVVALHIAHAKETWLEWHEPNATAKAMSNAVLAGMLRPAT